MTEEILEDLFKDENVNGFILSDERYKGLKDYITNLQQENERIKDYKDLYKNLLTQSEDNVKQLIKKLNEYKTRIDKATNYYLKELSKRGSIDEVAVEMYNLLEGNK